MNNDQSDLSKSTSLSDATGFAPLSTDPRFCENEEARCRVCKEMGARVVRSEDLLQGERELIILHGTQIYRLICTRNDKLLLQK